MRLIKITGLSIIILLICMSVPLEGRPFITGISPNLGPGSRGDNVTELQQRLKNPGYYEGVINGVYDEQTLRAVKRYQSNNGIYIDGIAGHDTLLSMGLTAIIQGGVAYAEGGSVGSEQLLARAINGEARGESYIGQVAVGAVILNRTRDSRFPKTIPGVIYQPGAFTAVSDGQINTALDAKSTVVKAAGDAINGWDPTSGAVYYWNPATATSKWIWSRQIVAKIGKHYFGK